MRSPEGLMPRLPDYTFSQAELELDDFPTDKLRRNLWMMVVDDKITAQLRKIHSHVPMFSWQYDAGAKTFSVTIENDDTF